MSKRKTSVTEDIKPSWLNPIRAVQAACKDNKGYAVLNLVVLVNKNDAIAWQDPKVKKIHPLRSQRYTYYVRHAFGACR